MAPTTGAATGGESARSYWARSRLRRAPPMYSATHPATSAAACPPSVSVRTWMDSFTAVPRAVRQDLLDVGHGLPRFVADPEQLEVARGDLPLGQRPLRQPAQQAAPVVRPEQHHREVLDLPGL